MQKLIYLVLILLILLLDAAIKVNGVLTANQGSLSYLIQTSADTRRHFWTIDIPAATRINILFEALNMYSAEVQIEEKDPTGVSTVFFKCPSCGDVIPPMFSSTRNKLTITAFGVVDGNALTPSSFTMKYIAILNTHDSSLNSITFNYNMGYAHIQPLTLTNGKLAAGVIQDWIIDTRTHSIGTNITLSLSDLSFPGSGCLTTLKIYDKQDLNSRKLLYMGCKNNDKIDYWLYSLTGQAYVVLDNTLESNDLGINFKLTYLGQKELYNCGAITDTLDTLTSNSAFLTDGSLPIRTTGSSVGSLDGSLRPSMNCFWLIKPTDGAFDTKLTLEFHYVSLKQGSQIVVYDSYNSSGAILWDSGQINYNGGYQGSTLTVPPQIISTNKELYVTFKSDSTTGTGYFGFKAEYFLNSRLSKGLGSRQSILRMSSAIDIQAPGDQKSNPIDFNYTYRITPNSILPNSKLTFVVNALNMPNVNGDTVTIYDGQYIDKNSILTILSGTTMPLTWFEAKKSEAVVVFRSNSDSRNWGTFKLNYFADGPNYHCGFIRNPIRLYSPAMVLTDGSTSTERLYKGQDCQWVVEPADNNGIFLYFLYFEVMGGSLEIFSEEYDPTWSWNVRRNKLVAKISNTMATPAPIFLPYSKIGFQYTTDSAPKTLPTGRGFRAEYFRHSKIRSIKSVPGDGVIKLYSSSMTEIKNYELWGYIDPNLNLTYRIETKQSLEPYIYFSFGSMNLTWCHAHVNIYDGPSTNSPLLGSYCGTKLPKTNWIKTSSGNATVTFISDGTANYVGDFSLSYYSNGPNSNCGFVTNPGILKSRSMVFTDGSSSNENLYSDQYCQWIIQPDPIEDFGNPNDGELVLEFLYMDLRGASLQVFMGTSPTPDTLLWKCQNCQIIPKPLISNKGSLYIHYTSEDGTNTMGKGFKAIYWTVNGTMTNDLHRNKKNLGKVLEIPPGIKMNADENNQTMSWHLGFTDNFNNRIQYYPRIISNQIKDKHEMDLKVRDGRNPMTTSDYQSFSSSAEMCGMVLGNGTNFLKNSDNFVMQPNQYASSFIESTSSGKILHDSYGTSNTALINSLNSQYKPAYVCKYILQSDIALNSVQSIIIKGSFSNPDNQARLRIYGGKFGNDALLWDSNSPAPEFNSIAVLATGVVAPCGQSLIVLELNSTTNTNILHTLDLQYIKDSSDTQRKVCEEYYFSLLPVIIEENPWIPYYIALGVLFSLCILFFCGLYIRKLSHKYYPENGCNPFKRIRIYRIVTPRHLNYTPKWDSFRNKFLSKGECAICQDICPIFNLNPCHHKLCIEDMAGYLGAALGDISLFPVKCPLHYEGCTSTIDAKIAKRVLDEISYKKFNTFSDRVKYGEGMRCIFCNNYVNFPEEGEFSMVECPYCVQTFCIRCKKPWHCGSKCPLEGIDDSLDSWKQSSGAQKCPACLKLIEKSDIETCNHMIHKITDGIPCVKDRTDFCYCCGEEIMGDYPHDEVRRPGVNHFPDGVYQQCLSIINKNRENERVRLKKMKRMKASHGTVKREVSFTGLEIAKDGQVATDDDGWEKIPDYVMNDIGSGDDSPSNRGHHARLGDHVDQQWDAEMSSAKVVAGGYVDSDSGDESDVDLGQDLPSEKVTSPQNSSPLARRERDRARREAELAEMQKPKPSPSKSPSPSKTNRSPQVASPAQIMPVPSRNGSPNKLSPIQRNSPTNFETPKTKPSKKR
jgi:hypothetical protein